MQANVRSRWMKTVMTMLVGGSAFQISGCDPEVRATLLDGLQSTTTSLSEALINAFFLGLDNNDDTTGGGLTTT